MYAYINRFPAVNSVMADTIQMHPLGLGELHPEAARAGARQPPWVWMIYIRDPGAARP